MSRIQNPRWSSTTIGTESDRRFSKPLDASQPSKISMKDYMRRYHILEVFKEASNILALTQPDSPMEFLAEYFSSECAQVEATGVGSSLTDSFVQTEIPAISTSDRDTSTSQTRLLTVETFGNVQVDSTAESPPLVPVSSPVLETRSSVLSNDEYSNFLSELVRNIRRDTTM